MSGRPESQGHRSELKVKGRCNNVYATRVSAASSHLSGLMAVVVGFRCDVISCELAREGVRRGTAEANININITLGIVELCDYARNYARA